MIRFSKSLMFAAFSAITLNIAAQDTKPDAAKGKNLFEANNCGSCHALDKKVVGPALRGVNDRRSNEWIISWVRNNKKFREVDANPDAIKLYNDFGGAAMNIYENLTPAQVLDIVEYIKTAPKATPPAAKTPNPNEPPVPSGNSTTYVLLSLVGVFFIVLLILSRVKSTLRKIAAEKLPGEFPLEGLKPEPWYIRWMPGFMKSMNHVVLSVLTTAVIGICAFLYLYYFGITEVGVQKGYAPDQPIAYNHKLHAGDLKIDCKYCHSTVEYSKQASIPSLNTCMNCHKGVQKASTSESDEISPEIKKIYAALDYDPEKIGADAFGPNPKPIRWVRIHNLPDHAYFNHSQHVKVGKLACQTCHGPIEKMEKVQQWSTLQMGWCIDCHRNTGIDVENNNYYKALHEKASADIKANGNKSKYFSPDGKVKVTPALNGGIECSKCHY